MPSKPPSIRNLGARQGQRIARLHRGERRFALALEDTGAIRVIEPDPAPEAFSDEVAESTPIA